MQHKWRKCKNIVNLYKDHASIEQIKNKIMPDSNQTQINFSFKPSAVGNEKKLVHKIDTKKAVGI